MVQVRRLVTTSSSASARRWAALTTAVAPSRVVRGTRGTASRARSRWSHAATTAPGSRKVRVARSSSSGMDSATSSGPTAKPALPPTMNHASPVAERPPEIWFATRAASGWNAAMPSPDATTHPSTPT